MMSALLKVIVLIMCETIIFEGSRKKKFLYEHTDMLLGIVGITPKYGMRNEIIVRSLALELATCNFYWFLWMSRIENKIEFIYISPTCLLYTSPSPRD